MTFLEQVHARRRKLADVLSDDDYGIRDIVEELYPDRAHFIYELLQNAEDTGAATANFELHRDGLILLSMTVDLSMRRTYGELLTSAKVRRRRSKTRSVDLESVSRPFLPTLKPHTFGLRRFPSRSVISCCLIHLIRGRTSVTKLISNFLSIIPKRLT